MKVSDNCNSKGLVWLNGFLIGVLFCTQLAVKVPSQYGGIEDPDGMHARVFPFLDGSNFDEATGPWINTGLELRIKSLVVEDFIQFDYLKPIGQQESFWTNLLLDANNEGVAGTVISGTAVSWGHFEADVDANRFVPWETLAYDTPGTATFWHVAEEQPDGSLVLRAVDEKRI